MVRASRAPVTCSAHHRWPNKASVEITRTIENRRQSLLCQFKKQNSNAKLETHCLDSYPACSLVARNLLPSLNDFLCTRDLRNSDAQSNTPSCDVGVSFPRSSNPRPESEGMARNDSESFQSDCLRKDQESVFSVNPVA